MKKQAYRKYYYMLIMLISGIFSGTLLTYFIQKSLFDKSILSNFIVSELATYDYFILLFTKNLLLLFIIILVSTSLIGIIIISFILYMKGIMIGYWLMILILNYHYQAIILLIIFIPLLLIELISIMLIANSGMTLSIKLINLIIKKQKLSIKKWFSILLNRMIIAIILLSIHAFLYVLIIIKISKWFQF